MQPKTMKKDPTFFLFSEKSNHMALEALEDGTVQPKKFETKNAQLWIKEDNSDGSFTLKNDFFTAFLTALGQNNVGIEGNL